MFSQAEFASVVVSVKLALAEIHETSHIKQVIASDLFEEAITGMISPADWRTWIVEQLVQ